MVHVPFFNIELPEPRLGALIPDAISAVVQVSTKALEYGHDLLHPPSPADLKAFEESFENTIPREFDRVRKRYAEGKILNDEQLSSELEDASFDWYRRQLRTSVLGATDEYMEDVAARKLGLKRPSLQAALEERYLTEAIAATGGIDLEAEAAEAAEYEAARQRAEERQRQLAARMQRLVDLRRQVRPTHRQALGTLTNASGGLLLGVFLFKSAVMSAQRFFKRRKPQQRPPPPMRRQAQQVQPQAAMQPQRPQAGAVQQQAPARQQGGAKEQQAAQAQAQSNSQATAAAAAAAGAGARKPRAVKKR